MIKYPKAVVVPSSQPRSSVKISEVSLSNSDVSLSDIQIRSGGNFHKKSFCLNVEYDWQIVRDSTGCVVLVPTIKPILRRK